MVSHNKKGFFFSPVFMFLCIFRPKIENKQPDAQNAQQITQRPTLLTMNPFIPNAAAATTCPPNKKKHGRGNKIMVGTVVKANVVEMK